MKAPLRPRLTGSGRRAAARALSATALVLLILATCLFATNVPPSHHTPTQLRTEEVVSPTQISHNPKSQVLANEESPPVQKEVPLPKEVPEQKEVSVQKEVPERKEVPEQKEVPVQKEVSVERDEFVDAEKFVEGDGATEEKEKTTSSAASILGALPPSQPGVFRARLFGSMFSYAYYFLDVFVGTPPQRQSVILDTGSSLLAFPCTDCEHCGAHLDPPFSFAASSTGTWVDCRDSERCFGSCAGRSRLAAPETARRCMYTQTYSEGSAISGVYRSDLVSFGDAELHNPTVRYDFIGCHVRETNLFLTQRASGIFGISFPKGFRQPTLIDVLFKQPGLTRESLFALCISEDGGLLTVGGFEPDLVALEEDGVSPWNPLAQSAQVAAVPSPAPSDVSSSGRTNPDSIEEGANGDKEDEHSKETDAQQGEAGGEGDASSKQVLFSIAWTALSSRAAYRVRVKRMRAAGVELGNGEDVFGKTLVDSGTTYSYFPPAVFRAWRAVVARFCTGALFCQRERDGRPCWRAPSADFLRNVLPSIEVEFAEGATILWRPQSYLYRRTGGFWCDGLDDNGVQESVLGLSFFKAKQIIFDRSQQRIGAVNARCPSFFLEERDPHAGDAASSNATAAFLDAFTDGLDAATARHPVLVEDFNSDPQSSFALIVFWGLVGGGALVLLLYSLARRSASTASGVSGLRVETAPPPRTEAPAVESRSERRNSFTDEEGSGGATELSLWRSGADKASPEGARNGAGGRTDSAAYAPLRCEGEQTAADLSAFHETPSSD